MTAFAWFALAGAIVLGTVLTGAILAVVALTGEDWHPDRDGFSDEEDE